MFVKSFFLSLLAFYRSVRGGGRKDEAEGCDRYDFQGEPPIPMFQCPPSSWPTRARIQTRQRHNKFHQIQLKWRIKNLIKIEQNPTLKCLPSSSLFKSCSFYCFVTSKKWNGLFSSLFSSSFTSSTIFPLLLYFWQWQHKGIPVTSPSEKNVLLLLLLIIINRIYQKSTPHCRVSQPHTHSTG